MPTLHWIGKEKVVNHHRDVPFRVLEHQYTSASPGPSEGGEQNTTAKSGGIIIHGDNLEALKALLPEYEGRVKCIYIDPPYNTGNEGWVYNDNVNDPKIRKWLDTTLKAKQEGKEAAIGIDDLARHDKWLCMMYPRLMLLHKLLADDGFIFVSIDYNSDYLLRNILNEIFGIANFRNVISVRRGIKNVQAQFADVSALSVGHEFIYLFSKNPKTRLPKLSLQLSAEKAGKWDTFWRGTDRPTMRYELFGKNPQKGQWRWEKGRANNAVENYNQYIKEYSQELSIDDYYLENLQSTNVKMDFVRLNEENTVQYYVPPQSFKLLSDNWMDILLSGSYTSFDTEKNVLLIERIVSWMSSTNKDLIILDSFAGSGTTAHAVLNLNKKDGGNRKFILIEMEDYAETITAERVRRVMNGYGEGNKVVEGTGGSFDYYTLGEPLFTEAHLLNELVGEEKIRQYVWFTETHAPMPKSGFAGSEDLQDKNGEKYLLGLHNNMAYYFVYEAESVTTLDYDLLAQLKTAAASYLIYADNCLLPKEYLDQNNIVFKKIPRDISRF